MHSVGFDPLGTLGGLVSSNGLVFGAPIGFGVTTTDGLSPLSGGTYEMFGAYGPRLDLGVTGRLRSDIPATSTAWNFGHNEALLHR